MGTFGGRRALTHVCALVAIVPAGRAPHLLLGRARPGAHASRPSSAGSTRSSTRRSPPRPRTPAPRSRSRTPTPMPPVSWPTCSPRSTRSPTPRSTRRTASTSPRPAPPATGSPSTTRSSTAPTRPTVLDNWFAVTAALLGHVAVLVRAGHRVDRRRLGPGGRPRRRRGEPDPRTASRTPPGPSSTARPRSSRTAGCPRSTSPCSRASSAACPPACCRRPAAAWRLERHDEHVLLDLDVSFPAGPVQPARLTVETYGADVQRLVAAAVPAVEARRASRCGWRCATRPSPARTCSATGSPTRRPSAAGTR